MAASIVITLDVGGSGVKASAFDAHRARVIASVVERYPADPGVPPGAFSPEQWWSCAAASCRSLASRIAAPARDYLGITVSAIRIPFVLIGADGRVVLPSLLNRDRRASSHARDLARSLGERALHATTGHWPAPEFGLPKLLWVRSQYPDAWRATAKILQLHDWFIFQLCGAVTSEMSSAAMSQMLDVRAGTWAADLLAAVDVPPGLLPPLHQAGARAGTISRGGEAETGLPRGLPVHLGGGDTHMSAMSAGALTDPAPVVVAGTTGPAQLAVQRSRDVPPGDYFPLLVSEQPISGAWALESNAGPTGEIVDRLADLPGTRGAELRTALAERGFQLLAGPDGPDGEPPLTVLSGNPFFGPAGWSAWPPPTVIGLRADHTGADVRLAGLRGTSWAFAAILDQLRDHSGAHPVAVTATGGMSRSPAWNQALADAARLPVRVRPLDLVNGLAGAALVAGAEVLASLDQIESTRYLPRPPADHDIAGRDHYQVQFRAAQCRAR
jgi:sugar (pentulose or hexulose) kinase